MSTNGAEHLPGSLNYGVQVSVTAAAAIPTARGSLAKWSGRISTPG